MFESTGMQQTKHMQVYCLQGLPPTPDPKPICPMRFIGFWPIWLGIEFFGFDFSDRHGYRRPRIPGGVILCAGAIPESTLIPGLARVHFSIVFTRFQNMNLDTKLTATDATDAKKTLIRRLPDSNPMDDVPDQDSAENAENEL